MSAFTFAMLLTGVLLNAAAQLMLKAGTNAVGRFEFAAANIVPIPAWAARSKLVFPEPFGPISRVKCGSN